MSTTDQLPEPDLGYIKTDVSNQPAFSARQMREAMQARFQVQGELEPYDAGLLNPFGGGNVEWWQDYIRAELGRAHAFYQSQITPQAEVTDEQILEVAEPFGAFEYGDAQGDKRIDFARAILALRPDQGA